MKLQKLEVQRLILLTFAIQVDVPMFRAGDLVSIMEDRAEVSKLQKGHGEWREDMTAVSAWICNL